MLLNIYLGISIITLILLVLTALSMFNEVKASMGKDYKKIKIKDSLVNIILSFIKILIISFIPVVNIAFLFIYTFCGNTIDKMGKEMIAELKANQGDNKNIK